MSEPNESDAAGDADSIIEVEEPAKPAAAEASEAAADAGAEGGQVAALREQLTLLKAQLEDSFTRARETGNRLKDEHERLLRTAAEFENFKKRATKEKEDVQKFGIERLLKDFLPVADNLERALDHVEQHDPKVVIEGVRLVQKMLDQAFGKHGLASFSGVGKPFDPNNHEALMQAESDLPPGTVVSEMARGYKLHDRLLRPAAVVVARARTQPEAAPAGSSESEPDGASPQPESKPEPQA